MFETLKMIIAILCEKEAVPEETISVTLAELSTVWIRYNNSFMDAIPKGPREFPPAPRIIEVAPVVEPAPDRTVRPEPKTIPPPSRSRRAPSTVMSSSRTAIFWNGTKR